MKKIINAPDKVVDEMLNGLGVSYPQYVMRVPGTDVMVRSLKKMTKVALISGGGSGHEPAHAGYVGEGMLDAAAGVPCQEALNKAKKLAEECVERTRDIIATKGRASYLGERSIGHIDLGAMSSFLLISVIKE